jgi:probable HAF family extracellular repeat protein
MTAARRSIVLFVLCAGLPAAAQDYTFHDLGTLGGTTSFARAVNSLGQVTGNAQLDPLEPAPRLNAFIWSPPSGPLQNIGVLPGSNNFSRGYAINDSGVIVGESDNNSSMAFRWDPVNGMTGLVRIAGGSFAGVAHGINNAGYIVGISSNGFASRPTIWDPAGVASDLGSLDGLNTSFGRAWAISNNGVAVGFSATGVGPNPQATMWNGAQILNLGSLLPDSRSEGLAINGNNVVVGMAHNGVTPSNTPIRRAVRWTLVGGIPQIEDLGSLGYTFADANGINDAGVIVGFATNISGSPQLAWIFRDGVMEDLNIVAQPPAGWTLTAAMSINQAGDIAGWGSFNGASRAFLLRATGAGCYANCDGSTTAPILNVADFTCFLTKFAAGDPYANCDGSTTEPILNVADFTCFLTKFAAGC